MTKPRSTAREYEAELVAARKAHGDNEQPNWLDRLRAVMKLRAKAAKPPAPRKPLITPS